RTCRQGGFGSGDGTLRVEHHLDRPGQAILGPGQGDAIGRLQHQPRDGGWRRRARVGAGARHKRGQHARQERSGKPALQHSMTFTARPPREVSLYLSFMSWPVSRIVLMTLSRLTLCWPSPRKAMREALIALTAPMALRSMQGICTSP